MAKVQGVSDPALTLADLTVVIVTFNSAHCIEGLALALGTVPNIIFSDNASADDTCATIARALPHARILSHPKNLGFGAANNLALSQVQTKFALLLNPDCLPTPDFFKGLIGAAERHHDAAIIAPHLIRKQGEVELSYRWPATHWAPKGPQASGPCCVGFACGAALLLNMKEMSTVGFFDEDFFLYYEDEDLCQRTFKAGKSIVLVPDVEVRHLSRGSVKGTTPLRFEYLRGFHHAQSKVIFEAKHFSVASAKMLRRKTLTLALLTLPFRMLLLQPRYLARLVGRIAGLCNRAALSKVLSNKAPGNSSA